MPTALLTTGASWTVPADVHSLDVELVGAGGGGGDSNGGGGGGGGGTTFGTLRAGGGGGGSANPAASGTTGRGGSGGTGGGGDGGDGRTTNFRGEDGTGSGGGGGGGGGATRHGAGGPDGGGDGASSNGGGGGGLGDTTNGADGNVNAGTPSTTVRALGGASGGATAFPNTTWGRGGDSASIRRFGSSPGGGGGGGYTRNTAYAVTAGNTISYTVGRGGGGGRASSTNGGPGQDGVNGIIRINYEVDTTPDAAPPTVTIDAIGAGDEGTSVQLSASVTGGTYDSIAYAWTADEGTLSGATTATPTWTRPQVSATKNVTLRLSVTVRGTGTNARSGTSATRSATRAASVRNLLPVAVAPSVTIDAIAAGDEGASVGLSASVTGGRYDAIDYSWTADQGALSGANTATPTWTRPQVSSGQNITLRLTVTARGTGTTARSGSSATRTATRAAAVVDVTTDTDTIRILSIAKPTRPTGGTNAQNHLPTGWTRGALDPTGARGVWESTRTRTFGNNTFRSATAWSDPSQAEQGQGATAPSLSIDAIGAADEGTTVNVTASVSGGRYDTLTYAWSAEGGTFSSTSAVSPRWTRPAVDADSDFDVRLTVTASGTGTNARRRHIGHPKRHPHRPRAEQA